MERRMSWSSEKEFETASATAHQAYWSSFQNGAATGVGNDPVGPSSGSFEGPTTSARFYEMDQQSQNTRGRYSPQGILRPITTENPSLSVHLGYSPRLFGGGRLHYVNDSNPEWRAPFEHHRYYQGEGSGVPGESREAAQVDGYPMHYYIPRYPSPPEPTSSLRATVLQRSPPTEVAAVAPGPQLRADGVLDWELVDDSKTKLQLCPGKKGKGDDESSEASIKTTALSYHGSDASEPNVYRNRVNYEISITSKPTASATVGSARPQEWNMEDRKEWRKRRYGSSLDDPSVNLKSAAAVSMPLEEMIVKNKITYSKERSSITYQQDMPPERGGYPSNEFQRNGAKMRKLGPGIQEGKWPAGRNEKRGGVGGGDRRRAAVIDGSSIAFEYGEGLHFDWKGIQLCVEKLVDLGYSAITLIVPEERIKTRGMSRNEHLIASLKKNTHFRPAWENHNDKLYVLKTGDIKNAVVISNDVWRCVKHVRPTLKYLVNRTLKVTFTSPDQIELSNSSCGRTVKDARRY